MSEQTDELDLDLEDEDEQQQHTPPPANEPPEGDAAPTEASKIAALEATVQSLTGKTAVLDQIAPLLPMAQQWLAKQNQGPGPDAGAERAALAEFGRTLKEKVLVSTDDAEAGAFLLQALDQVSKRNIASEAQRLGGPLTENAAKFALQSFLSQKRDEAGDAGATLHQRIAKEFALTSQQRAWLGQAPADQAESFLDSLYRQTAGDVLLKSSSRAKPRNLGGGGPGGGSAELVQQFPGVDRKFLARVEKQVAANWPDKPARGAPGDPGYVPPLDNSKRRKELIRGAIEAGLGATG